MTQPLPRLPVARTGRGDQLPERRRMIEPPQVHQLMNQHVVAAPPAASGRDASSTKCARRGRRSPIACADCGCSPRRPSVPARPRSRAAARAARRALARAAPAVPRTPNADGVSRARCRATQSMWRCTNASASRFDPPRGIVTRTRPSCSTRKQIPPRAAMTNEIDGCDGTLAGRCDRTDRVSVRSLLRWSVRLV